jgi:hypothetical protein
MLPRFHWGSIPPNFTYCRGTGTVKLVLQLGVVKMQPDGAPEKLMNASKLEKAVWS